MLTCEDHDGVFVYDNRYSNKCPICEKIKGFTKEIDDLEDEVRELKKGAE